MNRDQEPIAPLTAEVVWEYVREGVRKAAMLRTESVTIQAPVARRVLELLDSLAPSTEPEAAAHPPATVPETWHEDWSDPAMDVYDSVHQDDDGNPTHPGHREPPPATVPDEGLDSAEAFEALVALCNRDIEGQFEEATGHTFTDVLSQYGARTVKPALSQPETDPAEGSKG